jgi:hypothetical protein
MASRWEQLERALDHAVADGDRIAESVVSMDSHPAVRLLTDGAVTGLTARRWAQARDEMSAVWQCYSAFRAVLDRAIEVRTRVRRARRPAEVDLAELAELLCGPVSLDSAAGGAATLADLVARIDAGRDTVVRFLDDARAAWAAAVPPLDVVDRRLTGAAVLADTVGAGRNRVAVLRRAVDGARTQLIGDPLSARLTDPVPALAARLDELCAELAGLAALRDGFPMRLAALADIAAEVETNEATARQTYEQVTAKILAPGLPAPDRSGSAVLRARIDRLTALPGTVSWEAVAADADAVDRLAAQTRAATGAALSALTGLLDRRAELRGRLTAYRAKAVRLGFAEDRELAELHDAARSLLFAAPCDLPAATRALNRYRVAVTARTGPGAEAGSVIEGSAR